MSPRFEHFFVFLYPVLPPSPPVRRLPQALETTDSGTCGVVSLSLSRSFSFLFSSLLFFLPVRLFTSCALEGGWERRHGGYIATPSLRHLCVPEYLYVSLHKRFLLFLFFPVISPPALWREAGVFSLSFTSLCVARSLPACLLVCVRAHALPPPLLQTYVHTCHLIFGVFVFFCFARVCLCPASVPHAVHLTAHPPPTHTHQSISPPPHLYPIFFTSVSTLS